jgi:hypothetical protein
MEQTDPTEAGKLSVKDEKTAKGKLGSCQKKCVKDLWKELKM